MNLQCDPNHPAQAGRLLGGRAGESNETERVSILKTTTVLK